MKVRVSEPTDARVIETAPRRLKSRLALITVSCCLALSCSTGGKPRTEAPPPASLAKAEEPAVEVSKLPPPGLDQVEEAVNRVFKGAVIIDSSQRPAFVAGDFNGDLSEDIAVILKPAPEKLADMNREFSPWILRDPFGSPQSSSPRLGVAATDVLLAVIHGYGAKGWHDPEATQTYLLKNVAGSGMQARAGKEFLAANHGKKLPTVRGDLIGEVLGGKPGYIYYANATYAWYDPKTFTGEPEPRRGHGSAAQKMN